MTGSTNKSKQTKHEILNAAQKLFNIKGFQETSVNDIMKSIGVAKGAFYYYFETKDQVLDTLVEQNINEIVAAMAQVADRRDINALQNLKLMLQEEFRISMGNSLPETHLHNIKNVDMHQKIMVGMVEKVAPLIGQIVKQGVLDGTFRTKYPLEVSEMVIAGIHFISDLGIFHWSKEQYLERIRAAEELIEKTLDIEAGSFNFLSDMLKETPDRIMGTLSNKGDQNEK